MNVRLTLVALAVMLAGAGLSHKAQTLADPPRRARTAELELLVMPSAETLRPASMGQHRAMADILWVRSVLEFGDRFFGSPTEDWRVWFSRMVSAVAALDPTWRTVYFYGATMLRINGGEKQATRMFLLGAERLPEDPYFPFSAGMTIYLAKGDPKVAATLVQQAADRGGPSWYADLATRLRSEGHGRSGARSFLLQELEHTEDEHQRAALERQIRELDHEEFSSRLTEILAAHLEAGGELPGAPEQMVELGLLKSLPPDPLQAEWAIDPALADVLSAPLLEARIEQERRAGRGMLKWRKPKPETP